jgi:hypothetical protein
MRVVNAYKIIGFDIETYCKIAEIGIDSPNYICTMSFGTGMKKFCIIAKYSANKPYEIYIDRVEKNNACIIPTDITVDNISVKLVKNAIWTMHLLYPHVTKFTLFDDSQILCEDGRHVYKLHLAYESILKYNKTWYQKYFSAELPGIIADGNAVKIAQDSLMDKFNKSLTILDNTSSMPSFDSVLDSIPELVDFKNEYDAAASIREFISSLRTKYKNHYCFIVGKWLNRYMRLLGIYLYADEWFIPVANLEIPNNYRAIKLKNDTAVKMLTGGANNSKGITIRNKTIGQLMKWVNDESLTDSCVEFM